MAPPLNSPKTNYSRMLDLLANLNSRNELKWGLTGLELELEPGALLHAIKMAWKEAGRDGRKGHLPDEKIAAKINAKSNVPFTRNHLQAMFGDGRKLLSAEPGSRETLKYYQPIEQAVADAYLKIALLNWTKLKKNKPSDDPSAAASMSEYSGVFKELKEGEYSPCHIFYDLGKINSPIYHEIIRRMNLKYTNLKDITRDVLHPDDNTGAYYAALCFLAEWVCDLIYEISKSNDSSVEVRCCEAPGKSIFGIYKSFGACSLETDGARSPETEVKADRRKTLIVASDRKPIIMKDKGRDIKYWPTIMYDGLREGLPYKDGRKPTRMHLWVFQEPIITLDENVVGDLVGIHWFRSMLTIIRSIAINGRKLNIHDRPDTNMLELWMWLQKSSRICIKRNHDNFYDKKGLYNGEEWNNGSHLDPRGTPSILYDNMLRWSQEATQDDATVLLLVDHHGAENDSITECYSVDTTEVYTKPPARIIREPSDYAAEGFRRLARAAWEATGTKPTDALKKAREEGWYFLTPDAFVDYPFPLRDPHPQDTTTTRSLSLNDTAEKTSPINGKP